MSDAFARYLALEASILDYLFRETPYVIATSAKIDPLRHQLEAVTYMLKQVPLRIMLADDVGLGKTIMTGLLIRELMLRGHVQRVLIVVPRSLAVQWQKELKEKFELDSLVVKSSRHLEQIDLLKYGIVIVSIDLLKRRPVLEKFLKVPWDLVVFDEAHNLTVRVKHGRVDKTKRYEAAETIAYQVENVLLLTATPHHGKFEDFVYRIRLLDPNVPEDRNYVRTIVRERIIRRLREEVTDDTGRPLIPPRESKTVTVQLTDREYEFYREVTRYVTEYFNIAFREASKAHLFAAYVFQKRASSSIYSITRTLENRASRLKQILNLLHKGELKPEELEQKIRELAKRGKWRELLKWVVLKPDIDGIREELTIVESLAAKGKQLLKQKIDSKFDKLCELLDSIRKSDPERKFVVFTQYRNTAEYLYRRLNERGISATLLHGGMNEAEREKALQELRERCIVLVATDVASEGLNLQDVASVVINYDLPWNPTKLDQRIGRVHRYRQRKIVYVFNILVEGTIDNHVYKVLLDKIEEIRKTLGKVYDYLGDIVTVDDIKHLIKTWIQRPARLEDEIDKIVRQRTKGPGKELDEIIDQNRLRVFETAIPEDLVEEDDVKRFVLLSLNYLDRRCVEYHEAKLSNGRKIVYYELKPPRQLIQARVVHYDDLPRLIVTCGVFSRRDLEKLSKAQYIGLEHPLVQALIRYWNTIVKRPILLEAESKRFFGWLLIYRIEAKTSDKVPICTERGIEREIRHEKLIAILVELDSNGQVANIRQAPLTTVKSLINPVLPSDEGKFIEEFKTIEKYVQSLVEAEARKVISKIERELEILKEEVRTRYSIELERLFDKMSKESDPTIQSQLSRESQELLEKMNYHLSALRNIRVECVGPEPIAAIRILPLGFHELGIEWSRKLVEQGKTGEEIVKKFEELQGRRVIDLRDIFTAGFDFISIGQDEVRYIEVKTVSSKFSKIYITQREWEVMTMETRRRRAYAYSLRPITELRKEDLRDMFYLYVVDLDNKELIIIKNPAANLWRLYEKYRREYYKIEVPYLELRKILERDDVKENVEIHNIAHIM